MGVSFLGKIWFLGLHIPLLAVKCPNPVSLTLVLPVIVPCLFRILLSCARVHLFFLVCWPTLIPSHRSAAGF